MKRAIMAAVIATAILSSAISAGYAQGTEASSIRKGMDLLRHDKFDEAIAEFGKAVTEDPGSASAYYNLGFAYDKKGDMDKAIANFTKAIEIDPALADAYYNRGFAYYKKGNFEKAIGDYAKVVELAPDSADAYYGLGLAYSKKNDLSKAIEQFTKAIKARPDFVLAYDARAAAYVMKKNYLGAMADVNKAQALGYRARRIKWTRGSGTAPAAPAGAAEGALPAATPGENPFSGDNPRAALITAGIIFLVVSIMHLLRMIFRKAVMIGRLLLPPWLSAIAFAATLGLSLWMFWSAK